MSITVAQYIAEVLVENEITTIYGQSLPSALILAAEDCGIRQLVYRTENAGGTMADGQARMSHRMSVVAAQNGPAATLLVPPLSEAYKASTPVLALVQDVPRNHRNKNAFQEFDHRALFSGCVKHFDVLDDATRVGDFLEAAIRSAISGRPGPAVLMLPKDVLVEEVPDSVPAPRRGDDAIGSTFPLDRTRPPAAAVDVAADIIAAAEQPVVIAGGGVIGSSAQAALVAVAELASLPVGTTSMGKGAIGDDHPLAMGVIGNFMGERGATRAMHDWMGHADVVVLAGTRTNENGTDAWTLFSPDATFIHLDIDPEEIGRNYPALRLPGDVRVGLDDLAAALGTRDLSGRSAARPTVEQTLRHSRTDFDTRTADVRENDQLPMRPERVMSEIAEVLRADSVVVGDASYSSIWVANYVPALHPGQRFLLPRGLAGLGWGLPLALGAKAAQPSSSVICVAGDGGFAHCWAELETAVREQLGVVVVVLNNEILGYQKHAEIVQFGRPTSAVHLGSVDHAAIARACGARGVTVQTPAELAEALAKALVDDLPTLLDVIVDPDAHPPIRAWDDNQLLPR